MKIKRFSLLALIGLVFSVVALSGCSLVAKPADVSTERPTEVLLGTLNGVGGRYLLKTNEGDVELDSDQVDLSGYEGQTIQVEGEYSGTTLFVDRVL